MNKADRIGAIALAVLMTALALTNAILIFTR